MILGVKNSAQAIRCTFVRIVPSILKYRGATCLRVSLCEPSDIVQAQPLLKLDDSASGPCTLEGKWWLGEWKVRRKLVYGVLQ
jgi:hypothetical protein